jgi:hypothetical protein
VWLFDSAAPAATPSVRQQRSGPLALDAITWARAKDLIAEVLTRPEDERDEYDIANGPTVPEIKVTRDPDIEMWDK